MGKRHVMSLIYNISCCHCTCSLTSYRVYAGVFSFVDAAIAVAAVSMLLKVDQTFDPSALLPPEDCALLALAACGLGFALRGFMGLLIGIIFSVFSGIQ